jgi:signal peptidase I
MHPAVNAGDVAIVTRVSEDTEIQKGDVIAFKAFKVNEIIIHRVIDLGPTGFVTKGDANEEKDFEPVSPDRVLGIYRFRIPLLGFFFEGIKKVTQLVFREKRFIGWTLLVIIPLVIIFTARKKKSVSSEIEKKRKYPDEI